MYTDKDNEDDEIRQGPSEDFSMDDLAAAMANINVIVADGKKDLHAHAINRAVGAPATAVDLTDTDEFRQANQDIEEDKLQLAEWRGKRFRDDLDTAYWFGTGLIGSMIEGQIWDTVRGRDLLSLVFVAPQLLATIPQKTEYHGPFGETAKALWMLGHGESTNGKGAAYRSVKALNGAIAELDYSRAQIRKSVSSPPKDGQVIPVSETHQKNDSLAQVNPRMVVGDITAESLLSVGAAHEEYDRYTTAMPGAMPTLVSTGIAIVHSEGAVMNNRYDLDKGTRGKAIILNQLWSGEAANVTRKTNSEDTTAAFGLSFGITMIDDDVTPLLQGDNNGVKGSTTPNGFTGRLLTFASEKTSDDEVYLTPAETMAISKKNTAIKLKLKNAIDALQAKLWAQQYIVWDTNAIDLFRSRGPVLKALGKSFDSKLFKSFANRLVNDHVVRMSLAFAMIRSVDAPEDEVVVLVCDVERAFIAAELALHDRLVYCAEIDVSKNAVAVEEASKRSLKANEDRWYQIFSDPDATRAWVQGHKANGENPRQIARHISGGAVKRLKVNYGIAVSAEVARHFD